MLDTQSAASPHAEPDAPLDRWIAAGALLGFVIVGIAVAMGRLA